MGNTDVLKINVPISVKSVTAASLQYGVHHSPLDSLRSNRELGGNTYTFMFLEINYKN